MKLYGSQTSPFVRRIRLVLAGLPHEFVHLNIFAEQDREFLTSYNPTQKIPMLEHNGQVIFDSGVIYRYLAAELTLPALSWYQENQLTVINAVNDSLVSLFLCSRSDLDTNEDRLFFNLQRERIALSLFVLEQQCANQEFSGWQYPAKALFCLLDWIQFRQLVELDEYPALLAFLQHHQAEAGVAESDPRLS